MATTVLYQPGMTIGRVFDMRTFACGLNIFSPDDIAKTSTVERHSNTVKYSVIKKSSDVNNILGISGDISLKAKAGIIDVEGVGSYLKEDRLQDNVMEILARAQVETVTVSMDDATPKEGWATNVNGTHYIRSMIYGGDLVVRISIKGSDAHQMKEVKGKSQGGLATHGIIDAKAQAAFKKLEQDMKSSSEIDIEYYSTTPKGEMPRDIDGMLRALDTFKTEVQQPNDNKGVPCKCEIVPLHYLDATIPALLKSGAYTLQIKFLEEELDDVQIAKNKLHSFLHEEEDDLEPELETDARHLEKRIDEALHLEKRIDEALELLMGAISEIDITSPQQTADKIKEARSSDKMKGAGGFHREVNKFIRTCACPKKTREEDMPKGSDLTLCILGKTGHGKSSLANTILGEDWCTVFSSSSSGTKDCNKKQQTIGERTICVVDTPGTMDTRHPRETLLEIGEAIAYGSDGFDAFLITLRWNTKMTSEEVMAIELMKKMFGKKVLMEYAVFVFTYGDTYVTEQKRKKTKEHTSFKDYLGSQSGHLKQYLAECKQRWVLINNMDSDPGKLREQLIEIVNTIDKIGNKDKYSNEYFEEAKKQWEIEEKMNQDKKVIAKKVAAKVADTVVAKSGECFPADARVSLETGETIPLSSLQIGQRVLVSLGKTGYDFSTVYLFGHLQEASVAKFINIETENHTITLSPDHYLYTRKNQCWVETAAEDVATGDILLTEHCNVMKEEKVTRISTSFEKGLYAPFTMTGTIVVNGVLASCYVNCISPGWAHVLLWPVRQLYRLCPSLLASVSKPKTNGIPTWIQFLRRAFNI
ncbi:uncharacterized protein LOC124133511 isoform X2 [Haliotis rufescens]|nr:uncharacterized protein LOC124133511 isoform X2 [Haliotis rufescens]XP_046353869.1 uncharacterized protein LOC124133511 isoform X2 [Haliotis rufescens]